MYLSCGIVVFHCYSLCSLSQVSKGQQEIAFFSLPEHERWKATTDNANSWRTKYYKGLGTSTAKEAKEYFSDMERHRIPFEYGGPDDDAAINLVRGGYRYIIILCGSL